MTSCWSQSSTGKKYPYYLCRNKSCEMKGKSIPRDEIEDAFQHVLKDLQPNRSRFELAAKMFKDWWEYRNSQSSQFGKGIKQELVSVEKQIGMLLDRIMNATSATVVDAYENRIAQLERKKLALLEKSQNQGKTRHPFEELFERALTFLANPCKIWEKGGFEGKRMVLRLAFLGNMPYIRGEGFSNVKTSIPFNVLGGFSSYKSRMVV